MCAAPSCCNGGTAFIGFYGVEPRYQNMGIGRELWSQTVGRLNPDLNKGLYGVPEMADKYKDIGFVEEDAISMLVYTTKSDQTKEDLRLDLLCQVDEIEDSDRGQLRLEIFDGHDGSLFEKLIAYDAKIQGFSREELLRAYLLGQDIPLTVIILDPTNELPLAYGCIRRDNNCGGIIGPIYADNSRLCEVILRELLVGFELEKGKIFTIMPLTSNQNAIDILRKIGFNEEHDCSRLFTKFIPKADMSKIFYIHSPNFNVY